MKPHFRIRIGNAEALGYREAYPVYVIDEMVTPGGVYITWETYHAHVQNAFINVVNHARGQVFVLEVLP